MRHVIGPLGKTLALTVIASASWWACTSKTNGDTGDKTVEVGYGDTCGEIAQDPNSLGITHAECDAGVTCKVVLHTFPDAGFGLTLGLCTDGFAACSGSSTCPSGFACKNVSLPETSAAYCLKICSGTDECEGPFQICYGGVCRPASCMSDGDCQAASPPSGDVPHCSDNICVRGDASTR